MNDIIHEWEARNVAWCSVLSSQHDHLWPSKGANWRFIPMDVWNGYKNIGENPISKINREGKNKNMTRRCRWSVCWCNPGHPSCWFCCKNKNVTQKSHKLFRWCNVRTCNNLLADQKIWSGRGGREGKCIMWDTTLLISQPNTNRAFSYINIKYGKKILFFCEGLSKLMYSNKRPRKYHGKPETLPPPHLF